MVARQFFYAIGVDVKRTKPVMGPSGKDMAVLTAGGNVKLGNVTPTSGRAFIKDGMVRALTIADTERDPDFPNVPTTVELGYPTVNFFYLVWRFRNAEYAFPCC